MSKKKDVRKEIKEKDKLTKIKLKLDHLLNKNSIKIKYKTDSQKEFWNTVENNEITFCSGFPGSGKTYIAVAKALDLLCNENKKFEKIVLIKPIIEADEKIGYLPGSLDEKIAPYIYSINYIFQKIISKEVFNKLIENEYIEVLVLAYMRGINIDNSIVICDEAQNMSIHQMKTLLTRIGENSKFILIGDLEQSDKYKKKEETGLYDSIQRLKNIDKIGMFEFKDSDIVRNPLIGEILKRYE